MSVTMPPNARTHLSQVEALFQWVVGQVRPKVLVDGRVSTDAIDQYQQVSFSIAWCAAELAAAKAMLDYQDDMANTANTSEAEQAWEVALASSFVALAIVKIRERWARRPEEFGLSWADLRPLYEGEVGRYCQTHLASEKLAALGGMAAVHHRDSVALWTNEDQRLMRDTFRRLAEEVVMPWAEKIHRHDLDIPDEILAPLLEMGLFGLSIPQRFGGWCDDEHGDTPAMIIATEELSRASLGAAGSLITRPEILARALLAGGTPAQQADWLPRLAAGDPFCAVAVTEPDYGSDVANMQLRATKVEGGWTLKGVKTWCTFGGKAGVLLVLARTEHEPDLGHKGLSLLLAEKPVFAGHEFAHKQPGGGAISGRAIPTIGYRGMHSFEVFFDDYFVPDSHLIGEEEGRGRGFYYMMSGFAGGRIQTAARAMGLMQAALEESCSYAQERAVFGTPLATYQLIQIKLAHQAMALAASRKLTYQVARWMDEGKGQMEASLAKLFACRAAEEVTREAIQIHGGMGYAEETHVSRYFVDARVLSIFEGAEEVLALKVIARQLFANVEAG